MSEESDDRFFQELWEHPAETASMHLPPRKDSVTSTCSSSSDRTNFSSDDCYSSKADLTLSINSVVSNEECSCRSLASSVNLSGLKSSPKLGGRRRKPLHPQKTPSLYDPNFQGVTLCFHTLVHGSSSELIITPVYSKNLRSLRRRHHQRMRHCCESEQEGGNTTPDENCNSADELLFQPSSVLHSNGSKSCASCATRRTPLWRDAEDGTPLCNACGIRYRKYRLRCSTCWHIPRKDSKVFPACSQCGGPLRLSQSKKC